MLSRIGQEPRQMQLQFAGRKRDREDVIIDLTKGDESIDVDLTNEDDMVQIIDLTSTVSSWDDEISQQDYLVKILETVPLDKNALKKAKIEFKKYFTQQEPAFHLFERSFKIYPHLDQKLRVDGWLINKIVEKYPSFILSIREYRKHFSDVFLEGLIHINNAVFSHLNEEERGTRILVLKALKLNFTHFKSIPLSKKKDIKFIEDIFSSMDKDALRCLAGSQYLSDDLKSLAYYWAFPHLVRIYSPKLFNVGFSWK